MKPTDEILCDECVHNVVCGKLRATGGVNRCEHFMRVATETTSNNESLFDKVSNIDWRPDKQ